MPWELTGVPYTSAAKPGGIAGAIAALRTAGLAGRLAALGVPDRGDLDLLPPDGVRGPRGLLNEPALDRLVVATRERVLASTRRGARALLLGGDCPVLLGALAALTALRDGGDRPGLVMLDGHEDAWPPGASATGEASDSELAIALGQVPGFEPLVTPADVALLGPRDARELAAEGVRSLRGDVAYFADDQAIRNAETASVAEEVLRTITAPALWLHIDLDVLGAGAFPAVDYPQPGGLDWAHLDGLAAAVAADPRCRGVSVTIYNPTLDPDRTAAAALVDFTCRLVTSAHNI